jgi:hypothetical protein
MGLKTYDYIVTLKPTANYKVFDWMSWFLLLIAVAKSALLAATSTDQSERIKAIVFAVLVLGSGIYCRATRSPYRVPLFLSFIVWIILLHEYLVALLYAVCGILEKQVKFKRELGFDEEGITVNTFPKKTYKWHEVSNVVLKDGIITVDLYNNRIIQKELEDEAEDMEQEFNQFCRSHLLSV